MDAIAVDEDPNRLTVRIVSHQRQSTIDNITKAYVNYREGDNNHVALHRQHSLSTFIESHITRCHKCMTTIAIPIVGTTIASAWLMECFTYCGTLPESMHSPCEIRDEASGNREIGEARYNS